MTRDLRRTPHAERPRTGPASVLVVLLLLSAIVIINATLAPAQDVEGEHATLSGTLTVAPDFVVERYRERAAKGDAKAQFYLGYLYERRLVPSERPAMAVAAEWYGKAAEAGHAPAQYKRAAMAQAGIGGARDLTLAARLYESAADQGLAEAQYNFAVLLEQQPRFAKSPKDARYWYERAAYQGVVPAMLALGRLYGGGSEGEPDLAEAWAWLALAEETEKDPTGRTGQTLKLIADHLDEPRRSAARDLLKAYRQLLPRAGGNETLSTDGSGSDNEESDMSSQ